MNNSTEELGKEILRLQQVEVERMKEIGQQAVKVMKLEQLNNQIQNQLDELIRVNKALSDTVTEDRSDQTLQK